MDFNPFENEELTPEQIAEREAEIEARRVEMVRRQDLKDRFLAMSDVNLAFFHPSFTHRKGQPNKKMWLKKLLKKKEHQEVEEIMVDLETKYATLLDAVVNTVDPREELKEDIKNMSNPSRAELRDMIGRIINVL